MTALKQKPRKTIDDFRSLPDESRAELIEGEILMTPAPNSRHQLVVVRLLTELQNFVASRKLGWALVAPTDVHLKTGEVVQPDLLWVSPDHASIVGDWIQGAPDLAVEVLSPTSLDRDRFVKKDLYARAGIREYWIVDPEARTVEIFTLAGDRYEPAGYFTGSAMFRSPVLAGFEVPLPRLFE